MTIQRYSAGFNESHEEDVTGPDPNGKWVKYEDYLKLLRALKITSQANRELSHAMECGPGWYTKGRSGMYSQCWTWLLKGLDAAKPYEEEMADLLDAKRPEQES